MKSILNKRPSAAMVVAFLALGIALNGPAFADKAVTIASKVSGKKIKKRAISSKHIRKNAVRSKHVKNGSLRIRDFKKRDLKKISKWITGRKGEKGDTGANGANGARGANGATGANGARGTVGATGANGARGATGNEGEDGASGPAGPTAARAVSRAEEMRLTNSDATYLDLYSANSSETNSQISITSTSLITATATINASTRNGREGSEGRVRCSMLISNSLGRYGGLSSISEGSTVGVRDEYGHDVNLMMTGASEKRPGTYNVVVRCSVFPHDTDVDVISGNLTVVATATS